MKKISLFLIICLVCLSGCSLTKNGNITHSKENIDISTDGELYQEKIPATKSDIIKNIDVKIEKAKDNSYIVFITNNNTFVIPELKISVNFYKNDILVDTDKDGHDAILPGYTLVSTFESYEKNDNVKYELSIEWTNDYINHSDNFKIESNLNSLNDLLVTVKNNDSEEVDEVEIIAVFYDKEGNILGSSFAIDIYDLGQGESATEKLSLSKSDLRSEIDSYKIYINQAHTF